MSKGVLTVLCHTIEYDSENIVLDENAKELLCEIIANSIELREETQGSEILELENLETGETIGDVSIKWRVINPEADKWKEIADKLYKQLEIADNCISYQSLGKHRYGLDSDIANAMKQYEQSKQTSK